MVQQLVTQMALLLALQWEMLLDQQMEVFVEVLPQSTRPT